MSIFMRPDDFFTFGKYEDYPLREVIQRAPSYIRWLIAQDIIEISETAVDLLEIENER